MVIGEPRQIELLLQREIRRHRNLKIALHQQCFGNLSIPNVMKTIQDRLPAIAKKTGVTLIVSKWEIQYSDPEIEPVDLTLQLVDLFTTDDATRKMIEEGLKQNQKPVPVEQLLNPYD